jgi:hypothetical protein
MNAALTATLNSFNIQLKSILIISKTRHIIYDEMGQTCSRHGRDDQKTSKNITHIANILCGYTEDNGDELAPDISKGQTRNNENDKLGHIHIVEPAR